MTAEPEHYRRAKISAPWRSLQRTKFLLSCGLLAAWMIMGLAPPTTWADPPLLFPGKTARVALDPGHGGRDSGARGPTGQLEKDICLELARNLALRLEPQYQVTLTRSDDYQVELKQRTAIANQAEADLLISLHAGAGYAHSTRGISIYYYAVTSQDIPPRDMTSNSGIEDRQKWDLTQLRHQPASLNLATVLQKHLDPDVAAPVSIHGAPLVVLEGADMPAVLIEIGHITNPATEARLSALPERERLVEQLYNGIQAYLASMRK